MLFLKNQRQQGAGWSVNVVNWIGIGLDVNGELTEAELDWVVGGNSDDESQSQSGEGSKLTEAQRQCIALKVHADPTNMRDIRACYKNHDLKCVENIPALTSCFP